MKRAILLALLLGGCGQYPPAGSQPRALLWGAGQPACAFWCSIQVSVTNAEGDTANTRGNVAQAKTLSTSQRQSQTYAPAPKNDAPQTPTGE